MWGSCIQVFFVYGIRSGWGNENFGMKLGFWRDEEDTTVENNAIVMVSKILCLNEMGDENRKEICNKKEKEEDVKICYCGLIVLLCIVVYWKKNIEVKPSGLSLVV